MLGKRCRPKGRDHRVSSCQSRKIPKVVLVTALLVPRASPFWWAFPSQATAPWELLVPILGYRSGEHLE